MIFVTLGSQKFPFDRLLKKIDELVADGVIQDRIFAQTGASTYIPQNYAFKPFLDRDRFAAVMKECTLVITHGGTGAIVSALKAGKKVIAVPRLARYGEHVDDHQLQLLEQFSQQDLICACYDTEQLGEAYFSALKTDYVPFRSNNQQWIKELSDYIDSL